MFIVNLPVDKYGNIPYDNKPTVIEVESFDDKYGTMYRIIAPELLARRFNIISPRAYPFIQVQGPARSLTEEEYVEIIEKTMGNTIDGNVYIQRATAR